MAKRLTKVAKKRAKKRKNNQSGKKVAKIASEDQFTPSHAQSCLLASTSNLENHSAELEKPPFARKIYLSRKLDAHTKTVSVGLLCQQYTKTVSVRLLCQQMQKIGPVTKFQVAVHDKILNGQRFVWMYD